MRYVKLFSLSSRGSPIWYTWNDEIKELRTVASFKANFQSAEFSERAEF